MQPNTPLWFQQLRQGKPRRNNCSLKARRSQRHNSYSPADAQARPGHRIPSYEVLSRQAIVITVVHISSEFFNEFICIIHINLHQLISYRCDAIVLLSPAPRNQICWTLAPRKVKREEASLRILMGLDGSWGFGSCWRAKVLVVSTKDLGALAFAGCESPPNFWRRVEQYSDCSGSEFLAKDWHLLKISKITKDLLRWAITCTVPSVVLIPEGNSNSHKSTPLQTVEMVYRCIMMINDVYTWGDWKSCRRCAAIQQREA